MKKVIYILLVAALVFAGLYFYSDFFRGVKDGFNKATTEHSQTKENEQDPKETKESIVSANASVAEKPKASQDANAGYDPGIWKIEHNGKASYLFGSIHMGKQDMYPLPEKVMDAFAASDTLAVEIDISKVNQFEMAQKVQQLAIDMENPLPTVLSANTKEKYDEFCETAQSTCNMIRVFEPWMAAMTLEAMMVMQAGYSEELGIDKYFIREAKNKAVVELESLDAQLNMLDQMPRELQDFMVLGAVSKDEGDFEELMTAWKTGELNSFMEKAEREAMDLGISEQVADQFNDIFLYKRNQVMADGIADLIKQGKSVFAVVGAAHYAGENSVNQYLEAKGFKVERM